MAFYDDRRFLLSHINHSFITGDDNGICEVVMLDEDVFKNQHQRCLKLEGSSPNQGHESDRLLPEAFDLNYESDLLDSEQAHSYDIISDMDYICQRRRSNTAQRLDRLRKEKINQSKTKTIIWRLNANNLNEGRISRDSPALQEEDEESEEKDKIKSLVDNYQPGKLHKILPNKSGLSRLLEKYSALPKNPYDEYAQFDGGMAENMPVIRINIFVHISNTTTTNGQQENPQNPSAISESSTNSTDNRIPNTSMQLESPVIKPENNLQIAGNASADKQPNIEPKIDQIHTTNNDNKPLEIVIVSTARVQDLIGLTCWQYTNEGREPKLTGITSDYCLKITEDNGEVDPDFSSLNPKEPLSKFNFPCLALTEKAVEKAKTVTQESINNSFPNAPSIAQNVITSSTRVSTYGKLAALTRILFRDAKLEFD